MEDGQIFYTMVDKVCVVKMIGKIVYTMSPPFDQFLDKLNDRPEVYDFVVDLSETTYIDSTNLGLLAKLNRYSRMKTKRVPTIISTNTEINDILLNIGLSSIFTIVNNLNDLPSAIDEFPHLNNAADRVIELMHKTHQELIRLSVSDPELYQDVVRYLEDDIPENKPITF